MEKFKDGKSGRNFVTEEPKFHFEAPKFNQKIDLPKASENPKANHYLKSRKLNPDKFYYASQFKEFVNGLKPGAFEDTKTDEARIIIPLHYKHRLVGIQGKIYGNGTTLLNISLSCLTITHLNFMDLTTLEKTHQSTLQKDLSTQRSFAMRLLCAEFRC